jgi:signal transduction histidine kinase
MQPRVEPARRSSFLTAWAVLLVLSALLLGSLSVFTFGAVCFSGLFYLWWRELPGRRKELIHLVNGAMLGLSTVWFVLNIVTEFLQSDLFRFGLVAVGFLYPPLIIHLYYLEATEDSGPRPVWKKVTLVAYVLGLTSSAYVVGLVFGALPITSDLQVVAVLLGMSGLFIFAGGFSAYMLSRSPLRKGKERSNREQRRMNIALLVGMALMLGAVVFAGLGSYDFTAFFSVVSRALPLIFLFVNSYYENRFEFFDVFVKRATFFFLALMTLLAYFSLAPLLIGRVELESWQLPWVYSLTLLPLVLGLRWAYQSLSAWLDRHWLGRVFSPTEAAKFFFEGLGTATSQADLVAAAETRLTQIFQAPVALRLGSGADDSPVGFTVTNRVAIPRHDHEGGWILLGPRPQQTPWFAGDLTLLSAMAEVFAYMLQNIRLQLRKQEQEKREQQLVLEASRSELKALRAQINPHFLFNALNVIASLTHRDPDRAEAVVEELAEVFRYTLSRSEQEWVRLEDELGFVRAYLSVEKARFGDRLQVEVQADAAAEQCLIPAMIVQTLVENAIKHGVSAVRAGGCIRISAGLVGDRLHLAVADNGPGIDHNGEASPRKGAGYGLKNVRSRLAGYFGESASLEVARDDASGMTVALIQMPANLAAGVPGRSR